MEISYKPSFVRQFKKLTPALKDEVLERIEMFRIDPAHPSLKTHRLSGRLRGTSSFSVNYAIRIVFEYEHENGVTLLSVGDHDVYKR